MLPVHPVPAFLRDTNIWRMTRLNVLARGPSIQRIDRFRPCRIVGRNTSTDCFARTPEFCLNLSTLWIGEEEWRQQKASFTREGNPCGKWWSLFSFSSHLGPNKLWSDVLNQEDIKWNRCENSVTIWNLYSLWTTPFQLFRGIRVWSKFYNNTIGIIRLVE